MPKRLEVLASREARPDIKLESKVGQVCERHETLARNSVVLTVAPSSHVPSYAPESLPLVGVPVLRLLTSLTLFFLSETWVSIPEHHNSGSVPMLSPLHGFS